MMMRSDVIMAVYYSKVFDTINFYTLIQKMHLPNVSMDFLYWVSKRCVRYIFACSFFKSKGEHLGNLEKCYLFHFKSSFRSRENQILEFKIFKFYDVIRCLSIKQGIYFTE